MMVRIVVDTNLWISSLISNSLGRLDDILFSADVKIVFDAVLEAEILTTVKHRKFRKYFDFAEVVALLERVLAVCDFVEVGESVELCRDPKDDFLLALSKAGDVDYLITGDADLLSMREFGKTQIVTVQEFERIFRRRFRV